MVAGVAASPDGAFVPVLLAALPLGVITISSVLLIYSLATLMLIVIFVLLATWIGFRVRWAWFDKHGDAISPVILVLIGVFLLMSY